MAQYLCGNKTMNDSIPTYNHQILYYFKVIINYYTYIYIYKIYILITRSQYIIIYTTHIMYRLGFKIAIFLSCQTEFKKKLINNFYTCILLSYLVKSKTRCKS